MKEKIKKTASKAKPKPTKKNNNVRSVKVNKIAPKGKAKRGKKKKTRGQRVRGIILRSFLILFGLLIVALIAGIIYIKATAPKFDPKNLEKANGTLIYDKDGALVKVIGNEKRQKVKYDDLPQILIDAIIATEDDNFFEHNGVDFPRLLKATAGQAMGKSAGGASTITMQLSKNSFTSTEASGVEGIKRKVTDIYLSMYHIEKKYSKKQLMEFYVNTPYLGSSSYGVEQASQTYFNKHVQDLTLVESATIASLFQSPSAYDPFVYPDSIERRKNQVLGLMLRHGYIDKKTHDEAVKITVKSLLVETDRKSTSKYQGFIDTVIEEVIKTTGDNPYQVPMEIYTTLDRSKQDKINNFYNQYKFKDNKVQVGIGVIDNKTGEIPAVGAGRDKTGEMSFNYATQINRHPGSTAKPLFDYAPGIEFQKWPTNMPMVDKPVYYKSGQSMNNWDGKYMGLMTMKKCLSLSRNTCALQAFRQVDNKKIKEFVEKLGIKPEVTNGTIGEWHSIGAFNGVNPIQLAAAYSAFGDKGIWKTPHSYTKIKYFETGKVKKREIKEVKAMSEETAYMIADILQDVTDYQIKVSGTDIATKTGTSSYDEKLTRALGLRNDVIQDSWTVTFSPDTTISIWYGYDKLDKKHYNTMNSSFMHRIKMQDWVVSKLMKENSKFKMPSGLYRSGGGLLFKGTSLSKYKLKEPYVDPNKKKEDKKEQSSTKKEDKKKNEQSTNTSSSTAKPNPEPTPSSGSTSSESSSSIPPSP